MNKRPEVTKLLTLAACVWLERRGGAVDTEAQCNGEDQGQRLDVVHLGPQRAPTSTGVEVKSCLADFAGDRKLHHYLGRVSELYVATQPGLLSPDQLPEGCGQLELNQDWHVLPVAIGAAAGVLDLLGFVADSDVFRVVREATPCEVPVACELYLLRGLDVSGRKLESGYKAQQQHKSALEQLPWLNKVKAA